MCHSCIFACSRILRQKPQLLRNLCMATCIDKKQHMHAKYMYIYIYMQSIGIMLLALTTCVSNLRNCIITIGFIRTPELFLY